MNSNNKVLPEYVKSVGMLEDGAIRIQVQFPNLLNEITYHVQENDHTEYGKDLYARAVAGEFGEIGEYVPPSQEELARRKNTPRRDKEMSVALYKCMHYQVLDEDEQAAAWKKYYKDLHNLANTEWWPLVEEWPVAPE